MMNFNREWTNISRKAVGEVDPKAAIIWQAYRSYPSVSAFSLSLPLSLFSSEYARRNGELQIQRPVRPSGAHESAHVALLISSSLS